MAMVWLAGPRWGLAAPAARLGWILLLGLLWLVLAASGVRARRRAGELAPAGPDPGGPGPGQPDPAGPDPAAPLRDGMARALSALRGSRPGRRQRLALPWHLVLGAPGVGKTSLLEHSGLRFTLPSEPPPGPDGAGCRWHFATEGVLLEAPGRFAEPGADAGGWPELVRLLKARRRRAPLDGVILAMPLEELAGPGAADRGRRFRQRLGDLERRFGRKVPAYLVVTRLDRLRGFAAFCAGLPEQAAGPAWGAFLHEPGDRRRSVLPGPGPDLPDLAAARFDELCLGLDQAVADHLGRRPGGDPDLAAFPLEFRALGQGLLAFVEAMDAADPYHPRPGLRGFWFTSARPAPGPAAATGARVAARFALPDPAGPEPAPVPDRAWFLDGLLQEAILPDRHRAVRRLPADRPWIRAALLTGGLAAPALLAVAWLGSLAGNRDLLRATLADLREARDLAAGPGPEDRLRGLQVLQGRLNRLAGPPSLALRWGLYQGGPAERAVRAQYGADLSRALLEPVRTQLESALAASARPAGPAHSMPAAGPAEAPAYAALRTYLLLGQRSRLDPDHLADHLPRWWQPWLRLRTGGAPSPELARLAEATLAFYLDQRGRPDLPVIAVRPDLVAAVRARLGGRRRPTLERRYGDLKAKAAGRFEPLTLGRILRREDPDLRAAAGPVPGWFTRAAWEGHVRDALEAAAGAPGAADADWVLEEPGDQPGPEAARAGLEALYKAEYAQAWRRFLGGLEVRPWTGPGEAAAALGRLADPDGSALKQVLVRTTQETGWDNPTALDRTLRTARTRVLAGTGHLLGAGPASGTEGPAAPGPLGAQFTLAAWLAPPEGAAALDGFLERLRKIQARLQAVASGGDPDGASRQWLQATHQGAGELAEAQAWLDAAPGDPAGWAALRSLLQLPLANAYVALLPGAELDLERAWAREVHRPWQSLADAYPFADAEPDAPFAELVRFLQPGSGILARFLDTRLAGLVTLRDDGYATRPWAGRGPGFTRAFLAGISRLQAAAAVLGDGGPARFELRPEPCPGLAEIDLEIDGQRLQYRNGPQVWTAFAWPGPGPEPGARIHTVSLEGAAAGTLGAPGPMGLARLLAQSRVERPEAGAAALEWRLPGPAPARTGGHTLRFAYRRVSGPDPLRLATLRGLTLPARICR
jgi:type VI secretion system protein ImpL